MDVVLAELKRLYEEGYTFKAVDPHPSQSRTKLQKRLEEVERIGDEPLLLFLKEMQESYNSPKKPRLPFKLNGMKMYAEQVETGTT